MFGWQIAPVPAYTFEIRLDAPDGKKIGEMAFSGATTASGPASFQSVTGNIQAVTDGKMHDLYVVGKMTGTASPNTAAMSYLQFLNK